jgi:2-polyprenyl-3-methyl-5-hydroxy-6-metoxy-1,4-benzoquinol methylase
MYEFHTNKDWYFNVQTLVTQEDVIPFCDPIINANRPLRVLEIGCGEAGVLKAFLDRGDIGVGVELSQDRAATARQKLSSYLDSGRAEILTSNIYDIDPAKQWQQLFDLIILKDVIEHIPNQERFIPWLQKFLAPDGIVFFAYPPWWMPFGGHQQVCSNKILSKLPWFHLLPTQIYKWVLRKCGETELTVNNLIEVKETGITIDRLTSIVKNSGFIIVKEIFWAINPIYQYKFGLKKRTIPTFLARIPYLRNLYVTAHYIAFKKSN